MRGGQNRREDMCGGIQGDMEKRKKQTKIPESVGYEAAVMAVSHHWVTGQLADCGWRQGGKLASGF